MNSSHVTVVIVTYNSEAVIAECLRSCSNAGKVIVVDNGSTDSTLSVVKRTLPNAIVLPQDENLGFGRACNIGIEAADTDFLLFLNPDARMEKEALPAMLTAAMSDDRVALVGATLLHSDGRPGGFGADVFTRERLGKHRGPHPEGPTCVTFISGAACLGRIGALRQIGGFDPNIFLYGEDDELSLRLRQAGWTLLFLPQARVHHVEGTSTSWSWRLLWRRWRSGTWARIYLETKFRGRAAGGILAARLSAKALAKGLGYVLFPSPRKAWREGARLAGCLAAIGGIIRRSPAFARR